MEIDNLQDQVSEEGIILKWCLRKFFLCGKYILESPSTLPVRCDKKSVPLTREFFHGNVWWRWRGTKSPKVLRLVVCKQYSCKNFEVVSLQSELVSICNDLTENDKHVYFINLGNVLAQLVGELHHKPEFRGFDSRWFTRDILLT